MFAIISRMFRHLNKHICIQLYKSLVRTHLDYANSVYSSHKLKHIDQIESVQRRATKQIPGLRHLTYPDRLRKLKLPTLAYRRTRGDMIELYKIINGVYDNTVENVIKLWRDSTNRSSKRINI